MSTAFSFPPLVPSLFSPLYGPVFFQSCSLILILLQPRPLQNRTFSPKLNTSRQPFENLHVSLNGSISHPPLIHPVHPSTNSSFLNLPFHTFLFVFEVLLVTQRDKMTRFIHLALETTHYGINRFTISNIDLDLNRERSGWCNGRGCWVSQGVWVRQLWFVLKGISPMVGRGGVRCKWKVI